MQGSDEFYILMADVISSRKIKERNQLQKDLLTACSKINQIYQSDLIAPMEIIKGSDELGCALGNMGNIYEIITTLSKKIYPNFMRFVLVKGEIDVGWDTKDISLMDGPVFHKAADLMYDLKLEKLFFVMDTNNYITDNLISNNINLIYLIKKNWSLKKYKIINEYEKAKDQKIVGKNLGLSQQTVSYHITSSNYKKLGRIEKNLKKILKSLL